MQNIIAVAVFILVIAAILVVIGKAVKSSASKAKASTMSNMRGLASSANLEFSEEDSFGLAGVIRRFQFVGQHRGQINYIAHDSGQQLFVFPLEISSRGEHGVNRSIACLQKCRQPVTLPNTLCVNRSTGASAKLLSAVLPRSFNPIEVEDDALSKAYVLMSTDAGARPKAIDGAVRDALLRAAQELPVGINVEVRDDWTIVYTAGRNTGFLEGQELRTFLRKARDVLAGCCPQL